MSELNIWCVLIPVLIGTICAVIGYFWGKSNGSSADPALTDSLLAMEQENKRLKAETGDYLNRIKEFEGKQENDQKQEKAAPKSKKTQKKQEKAAEKPSLPDMPFDADQVKIDYGKRVKFNDLKIIEGIGPKIESLFQETGFHSWQQLAQASIEDCQEVLKKGGDRFRMHDPTSWPIQAKMAHENKWEELAKWQEEHKAGRL
jgi:predicted flap endonuclease-1-like 5' DNA nuclease